VPPHLGGCRLIQYGRTAMRMQGQHPATRAFLVLAMALGSLWAGGWLASAGAANPADQLTDGRSLPGVAPAALRDRIPALRPPVQRSRQSARLVPLLVGMVAAACSVGYGVDAARRRSRLAMARSLAQLTQLEARAPPSLQPA
jgi:hypothetical protein